MSKQKYWLHWNIRGWVAFKYSTRVFRQACPEPILHRLEYSHNDMVWLIRALPELEHISDWQPFFAAAQPFGLRKRLYNLLEFAQKAGLLKPMPLAIQFSSFDQMQFRLFQSKSWLSRASYAYFIQLQKNQRNP